MHVPFFLDPGREGEVAAEINRRRIRQLDARVDLFDHHRVAHASGSKGRRELRIDRAAIVLTGNVLQVVIKAEMGNEVGAGCQRCEQQGGESRAKRR
jgi:hypothetical protein